MEATATDESLFSCPNDGCVKTYQRYSALEKHLSFGKCELVLERESLLDKAKRSTSTSTFECVGKVVRHHTNVKNITKKIK